jgi:RNA polymerase sigma-70 factor (ECF subfamily)
MPDGAGAPDFAAFYDEFLPQVYRYVRYRVADIVTAEDLTATIFERALRAWDGRRRRDSDAAWIFRIARNTVTSHYRRKSRRAEVPLDDVEIEGKAPAEGEPEERVLHVEQWERIRDGVRTLSTREQEIIALKFGSGMTNRAIAPIVGISEGNVAVILHRAMRKLHAYLESEQGAAVTPIPPAASARRVGYD